MQYHDIRREILLNVDKEVKELISMCSVDKLAQKICSKEDFWLPIFKEKAINFPKFKHTTSSGWIHAFSLEITLKTETNRLMEKLNLDQNSPEFIGGMYINGSNNWFEIFDNIVGIDIYIISNILNVYRNMLFIKDEIYAEDIPTASITTYNDGIYDLNIHHYETNIDLTIVIDANVVELLLYRILYTGTEINTFEDNNSLGKSIRSY